MDGFEIEVLNRLPLAEAVPTLFRYAASDQVLGEVFDKSRGRAYEGCLTFQKLVELVFNALLVHRGCGRSSFAAARDAGDFNVTDQAAYGKLRRIPVAVSEALLSTVSHRMTDLVPSVDVRTLPDCFSAYEVIHIDGKKIKKLAKRLKPLRGVTGSLLGGKVLAAINGRSGLAIAMSCTLDGYAKDAPRVPPLGPQV